MPTTFVISIIFWVIAAIAAVSWRFIRNEDGQFVAFITAIGGALAALAFLAVASAKMAESGQNLNCFPIGANVVPTLAVPNPAG